MRKNGIGKKLGMAAVVIVFVCIGIYALLQYRESMKITEIQGAHTTSSYGEKVKFSGESVKYKTRGGYSEGKFNGELKNAFITSTEELKTYLSKYPAVYVADSWTAMYNDEVQDQAVDYFDDKFFKNHTLAIEVHDGTSGDEQYQMDGVTRTEDVVNINMKLIKFDYDREVSPHLEYNFIILDKECKQVHFNFKTMNVEYTGNGEIDQ